MLSNLVVGTFDSFKLKNTILQIKFSVILTLSPADLKLKFSCYLNFESQRNRLTLLP